MTTPQDPRDTSTEAATPTESTPDTDLPPAPPPPEVAPAPGRPPSGEGTRSMVPPRPERRLDAPPVLVTTGEVPSSVAGSFWLWLVSAVAGLISVAYAVTRFDQLTTELDASVQRIITEQQFAVAPDTLENLVSMILVVTFGGLVALVLVQALLAAAMHARQGWARVLLVLVGVATVPPLLVAQDVITDRARLGILLQGVFMVAAVVMMYRPESNAWFRSRGEGAERPVPPVP